MKLGSWAPRGLVLKLALAFGPLVFLCVSQLQACNETDACGEDSGNGEPCTPVLSLLSSLEPPYKYRVLRTLPRFRMHARNAMLIGFDPPPRARDAGRPIIVPSALRGKAPNMRPLTSACQDHRTPFLRNCTTPLPSQKQGSTTKDHDLPTRHSPCQQTPPQRMANLPPPSRRPPGSEAREGKKKKPQGSTFRGHVLAYPGNA